MLFALMSTLHNTKICNYFNKEWFDKGVRYMYVKYLFIVIYKRGQDDSNMRLSEVIRLMFKETKADKYD